MNIVYDRVSRTEAEVAQKEQKKLSAIVHNTSNIQLRNTSSKLSYGLRNKDE